MFNFRLPDSDPSRYTFGAMLMAAAGGAMGDNSIIALAVDAHIRSL
jgi:hypothetical protein